LACSNGSIVTTSPVAPASDWQFASGWSSAAADESGSNRDPGEDLLSSSPSPNPLLDSPPDNLILLLAEDNPLDANLVKEAIRLEHLPVDVYVAEDGEQAIDFMESGHKDPACPFPHLLLLDINLPRVDGLEVLRRIRAQDKGKNLPVLVVTSSDSPSDRKETSRLGASFFRKPYSYDEFMGIGAVVRQYLVDNRLLRDEKSSR
jgi:CheY-like chemotaxis protein